MVLVLTKKLKHEMRYNICTIFVFGSGIADPISVFIAIFFFFVLLLLLLGAIPPKKPKAPSFPN